MIQPKNLILKHIFFFLKSVNGGPLTKTFPTPENFYGLLYQSQDFIRTLNIFTYYLSSLLLIQPKKFNFKALFYFQKSVKGGPLTKIFFQAEDGIRDRSPSRGLGDVYKRQQ